MRIQSLFIALAFVAFISCNKSKSDAPASSYIINNVQDMTITAGNSMVLPLEVKLVSGTQETVTLSISGLPAGATATFSAASGTPTFNTVLTVQSDVAMNAGDYPLKITGTTASGTKSYDFVLHVQKGNYWKINNTIFTPISITRSSSGYSLEAVSATGDFCSIQFWLNVPTTNGTYNINDSLSGPNDLSLVVSDGSTGYYIATGDDHKTAQVSVLNGKISITTPAVDALALSGSTHATISCSLKEN